MGYVKFSRSFRKDPSWLDPMLKPEGDTERAHAMLRFRIFDTPSEEIFSSYTKLAALTLKAPIALMSFVDEDKVFYKESYGLNRTGEIVDRKNSPCTLAIKSTEVSQFRYALADPCILADKKNLAEKGFKFYAGAPIITHDHFNIGILAVVDKVPRIYTDEELASLQQLASEVMEEIEFRLRTMNTLQTFEMNLRIASLHKRIEEASRKE